MHGARAGTGLRPGARRYAGAMDAAGFELSVEIAIEAEPLRAFLCDLEQHVALHPLIESIEEIEPSPELPRARRYRVCDRIPVGPLVASTGYVAAIDLVGPLEVHGHAWQRPGVRLHTVYRLEPVAGGTRLVERATIEAPWGLRGFVKRQARAAHAESLAGMKCLLEARAGADRTSDAPG